MSENMESGVFSEVRAAIHRGDPVGGEMLLERVRSRGAEWYFLMGAVYYRRGWMDEAQRHYEVAARMEPENPEYRQTVERMRKGARYRPDGKPFGTLFAEKFCLSLAAGYVFCEVCGVCGTCGACGGACYICSQCVDKMPR